MADAAAYEAQRRRQVEENNRKLEELGLSHLSAAVVPPTAKTLKRKARAPTAAAAPIRRSGRVADLPEQPNYREQHILGHKKSGVDAVVEADAMVEADAIAKANAMAKAKQLEAKLCPGYPTFVKAMTSSYSLTLWLPVDFCSKHLPKQDEMISVVDEQDRKFGVKYHAVKKPRVSMWGRFVTDNKLRDGDCMLFQLIQPMVFKVYIIRASSCKENGN